MLFSLTHTPLHSFSSELQITEKLAIFYDFFTQIVRDYFHLVRLACFRLAEVMGGKVFMLSC